MTMAPKHEGSCATREGNTGRARRGRPEGRGEASARQGRGPALVDIDPWGALLESLLEEPAEPNSAPRRGGKRK